MNYSKEIEKLTNQLKYWKLMKVIGGVIGAFLIVLSVVIETNAMLNESEELLALGYIISLFAGLPIDVMIAGFILTFVWRRRIAVCQQHMEVHHNPEFQDFHDYSIPDEDKIKHDPLEDYTNKNDPFH